jgi:hypothetical protein
MQKLWEYEHGWRYCLLTRSAVSLVWLGEEQLLLLLVVVG